ncbi:MAG: glutathione S-transferase family protein [Rhodobacteraceae bacterium]|nr:glutathione S-transferase family protein [Paracoccaceae bacterium]
MLVLLNSTYSTCSQKVRLCLFEKGLPYTDRQINFRKREHLAPEYLALNPNGVVPTLLHDDRPVTDSTVIMEYLDDVFPDPPLAPRDAWERARMRTWLQFIDEVPTVAIRVPSFNKAFFRHYTELDEEARRSEADSRPLHRHFYRKMGPRGFSDERQRESLERLEQTVERMERELMVSEWLCGSALTIADLALVPTFDRMADLGLSKHWAAHPAVSRWWDAIRARPSFAATYPPGARISEIYADLKEHP